MEPSQPFGVGAHPLSETGTIIELRTSNETEIQQCIETLKESSWFMFCSEQNLRNVALRMQKTTFAPGDIMVHQGEKHNKLFVISEGHVHRLRTIEGQKHLMEIDERGSTIGAYYIMNQDPCYSDAKCTSEVVAYVITAEKLMELFEQAQFAKEVTYNLNLEIRRQIRVGAELGHTPLLEQHSKPTPYIATSFAAAIESFYRSAMNAAINAALSGQARIPKGALFPNMHLQVPTRVAYINGFKGIRYVIDNSDIIENADTFAFPTGLRLVAAILPGLCMTPISSLLEAYNAGHMNPEPLSRRWRRGVVPRSFREMIFGVGLNQLTDYCEERTSFISNHTLRNVAGSMAAGILAGYFSHVPHNLSTLKLLHPNKPYRQLFREYVYQAEKRLPAGLSPGLRGPLSIFLACVFPRGLLIRTTQIVGSFIILNGTINSLQGFDFSAMSWKPPQVAKVDDNTGIGTEELLVHPRVELMRRIKLRRKVAAAAETSPGSAPAPGTAGGPTPAQVVAKSMISPTSSLNFPYTYPSLVKWAGWKP